MNHARTPSHARPHKTRKRRYLAALIAAPLLMAGAAFAYFDLNQATSHVDVAATPSFTINISAPSGAPIAPGVGSQTITFTASNQLNRPQTVNSITYAVTSDAAGGIYNTANGANVYDDSCLASWFTLVGTPSIPPPAIVPTGGTLSGTITVSMTNTVADQDACEGDSPQVSATLN